MVLDVGAAGKVEQIPGPREMLKKGAWVHGRLWPKGGDSRNDDDLSTCILVWWMGRRRAHESTRNADNETGTGDGPLYPRLKRKQDTTEAVLWKVALSEQMWWRRTFAE